MDEEDTACEIITTWTIFEVEAGGEGNGNGDLNADDRRVKPPIDADFPD